MPFNAETAVRILYSRPLAAILRLTAEVLEKYFRLEVEGIENIPRKGGVVIIANHSGYSGADAIMLSHVLRKYAGRTPSILVHPGFFEWFGWVKVVAERFNFHHARARMGADLLTSGDMVMVFPEGVEGNFKSSFKRYRLRRFHSGFAWMASQARVPIVPCLVIGAEETHFNLGSLNFSKYLKDLFVPFPVNFIPLPAKWKIKILPPVKVPTKELKAWGSHMHDVMQSVLDEELRKRESVYFTRRRSSAKSSRD